MTKCKSPEGKSLLIDYKKQLEIELESKFSHKAIEVHGLNIGDSVLCNFPSSHVSMRKSYTSSKNAEGVIKVDKNNIVYIESIHPISQTYSKSNNRSGREYRSWWVQEDKVTRANVGRIIVIDD